MVVMSVTFKAGERILVTVVGFLMPELESMEEGSQSKELRDWDGRLPMKGLVRPMGGFFVYRMVPLF